MTTPDNLYPKSMTFWQLKFNKVFHDARYLIKGYELTPSTFTAHCGKYKYLRLHFGLCNARHTSNVAWTKSSMASMPKPTLMISLSPKTLEKNIRTFAQQQSTIWATPLAVASSSHNRLGFPRPTTKKQVKSFLGLIGVIPSQFNENFHTTILESGNT